MEDKENVNFETPKTEEKKESFLKKPCPIKNSFVIALIVILPLCGLLIYLFYNLGYSEGVDEMYKEGNIVAEGVVDTEEGEVADEDDDDGEEPVEFIYESLTEGVAYEPDDDSMYGFKICNKKESSCTVYGIEKEDVSSYELGEYYRLYFNSIGNRTEVAGTLYVELLGDVMVEKYDALEEFDGKESDRVTFTLGGYEISIVESKFEFREDSIAYYDVGFFTDYCGLGGCIRNALIGFTTEPIQLSYQEDELTWLQSFTIGDQDYPMQSFAMGEGGPMWMNYIGNKLIKLEEDLYVSLGGESAKSYANFCATDCTNYYEDYCEEMEDCSDFEQELIVDISIPQEEVILAKALLQSLEWEKVE